MLSKTKLKYLNSLKIKKNRISASCFLAEGDKIVRDILHSGWTITELFASKEWLEKQTGKELAGLEKIHETDQGEIKKISSLKTPQKVLAVVKMPEAESVPEPPHDQLCLALERIQDPGNLGTIIRTAAWFGIEYIFCSPDSVDVFNPKVIQSTMSAILNVKIIYTGLSELAELFIQNSLHVYGTFPRGNNIYKEDLASAGLVLMGNESAGISSGLAKKVTHRLSIPAYSEKQELQIDSLNLASATAIICSEFKRRSADS